MDSLSEAIVKLSSTPQQAENFVRGLPEVQLSWKPSPEVFSLPENILYIRDIGVV
jgi:hypothetical protein